MGDRKAVWGSNTDGTAVVADDVYLEPFVDALKYRYNKFNELKKSIDDHEGGLMKFSEGFKKFGTIKTSRGITHREWAPGAKEMFITGDFNNWNRTSHPLRKDDFGVWTIEIPNRADGSPPIDHASKIKLVVVSEGGMHLERIPAWTPFAVQNPETYLYDGVFWDPPTEWKYAWNSGTPTHVKKPKSLRIYECHVGMGSNDPKVGTYAEFAENVLPQIKHLGYNALQIMAIQEHAYYASFGYHVTNFFAVSSRSGTPEDVKMLIDRAHEMGIYVLMDIVHSHASSNSMDGLNSFDGTDHQYFHGGEQGYHTGWDSRCFNYGHWEVLRFLLSNIRWYMDEYHFDGFRYDGVTSMLYKHHGIGMGFTGNYNEYFGLHVDMDACIYMMLANEMIHTGYPETGLTIAEDVSGMPTLCRPVKEGGLGFDYRLGMAIPDKWIEILKKLSDEQWDMFDIVHTLTNRRWQENTIVYAESHDQAMVGDKTIAFWLMDKEMYSNMSTSQYPTPVIERGIALHKMIRLLTYSLGGEGYLSFMGNEFGHPEWIDFPREGNGFSYHHARRRWDLAHNEELRYKFLFRFDARMHKMASETPFCYPQSHEYVVTQSNDDMVIAYEKGRRLLFVFNFHTSNSYTGYRFGTWWGGKYKIVLDSDAQEFDGQGRVHHDVVHQTHEEWFNKRPYWLELYVPARTCQVYHCFEPDQKTIDRDGINLEAERREREAGDAALEEITRKFEKAGRS
ncbi:hypothetical protein NDN08_000526 [Rhodosorus marinus]|uniref:1,4-alpha-glucan branching enzyme n=1 Tax=Rhodosorus marinus TaxID=101924 RepID=A0AAV8UN94_9RHOD|nr:hypothetical protein NDN08_000526 [Rhodosorus marinus]